MINIKELADQSSEHIGRFINEDEVAIQNAIDKTILDAELNEKNPIFTLSYTVKINLTNNKVTHRLKFSQSHTVEIEDDIERK